MTTWKPQALENLVRVLPIDSPGPLSSMRWLWGTSRTRIALAMRRLA